MAMKDTIVIYHYPCLDGFTSAWVAHRYFGDNATYLPGNYGEDANPIDFAGKTVYFVDFSYKRDKMLEVAKVAKQIIVLDHHQTAIENLSDLYAQGVITGVFDLNRSGAGIVWDYFFPNESRPPLISYVEDRDLWRFALPKSKEVNAALFSYEYDFDVWDDVFAKSVDELQHEGEAILRKHMKDVHEIAEQARLMNIAGHIVPVANANYTYGSDIGDLLSREHPFAGYYWVGTNGDYNFGLRSQHGHGADVAAIAQMYGGGGHKHAAGFRVKSLRELWRVE
jgi:oligoribonuclease NrnB/cAMP/cGMP phosphodiesterase (DHH superfamily)